MATCIYCLFSFECLSAHLENRKCLSLDEVREAWKQYALIKGGGYTTERLRHDPAYLQEETSKYSHEQKFSSPGCNSWDGKASDISDANHSEVLKRANNRYPQITRGDRKQRGTQSPSSISAASTASSNSSTSILTDKALNFGGSSNSSLLASPARERANIHNYEQKKFPIFITWNVLKKATKSLRGCIGTFEPQELKDGLRTYALTSALEDHRFDPISLRELPNLECNVTLLTEFESIDSPMDWEIGIHGIKISFAYQFKHFGATYLPEIAKEQGWTKTETLVSLMRKAGWAGKAEDWVKVDNLKVVRYKGEKTVVPYSDWKTWRLWVERDFHTAS